MKNAIAIAALLLVGCGLEPGQGQTSQVQKTQQGVEGALIDATPVQPTRQATGMLIELPEQTIIVSPRDRITKVQMQRVDFTELFTDVPGREGGPGACH